MLRYLSFRGWVHVATLWSFLLAAPALAVEIVGLQKLSDVELQENFSEYFEAEAKNDWKKTYGFRGRSFQKIVPFGLYAVEMSGDAAGWQMKVVEVTNVEPQTNGDMVITVRFAEKILSAEVSKEMGFGGRSVITHIVQETAWRYGDGRWMCLDAGDRLHLPLNRRIGE